MKLSFHPSATCYYDPKLLFDRINEVISEIYTCGMPSLQNEVRVAGAVVDEISAEADYFLLSEKERERRGLDEIASEDAKCGSWLDDIQLDTERIVVELEEFLLDTMFQFYT
ncbi:hypothetical protein AAHA92_03054 [Salvia divinorum]